MTDTDPERTTICRAHGSGRWFPGTRKHLESMVDGYIEQADVASDVNRLVAGIAPHAGYVYSGKVSGHTFRAARDNVYARESSTVVILGSSHRARFSGTALLDCDAIETPLGQVPLDRASTGFLAEQGSHISLDRIPHDTEHSAENEIPFVQRSLPNAKLVVGLIGDHAQSTVNSIVDALDALAQRTQLFVIASTDMLHDPDYDLVSTTDRHTLALVSKMDHAAVLAAWTYSHQVFCGLAPVLCAMRFAQNQGCEQAKALYYCNSGDDYPESRGNWVVGYGAVVFPA